MPRRPAPASSSASASSSSRASSVSKVPAKSAAPSRSSSSIASSSAPASSSTSSANFADYEPFDSSDAESSDSSSPPPPIDAAERERARADFASRAAAAKRSVSVDSERGVLYVGHIPHGFFDDELRSFFGQFGVITRVRVARNRKTGNSRGFAFVEFQHREVAEVAAQAMNRYMMFGRTLVCEVMENGKVHPNLFDGAERKYRVIPHKLIAREQVNQPSLEQQKKRTENLLKHEARRKRKLAEAGIDYEFDGFAKQLSDKGKTANAIAKENKQKKIEKSDEKAANQNENSKAVEQKKTAKNEEKKGKETKKSKK